MNFFKNKWLIFMIILATMLVVMTLYKKLDNHKAEGFNQNTAFVLKRNNEIYDSYYAMIYDDLYKTKPRVEFEYKQIVDMTHPTKENSVFLDVGSGTGNLVNKLTEEGYPAYGIDESHAMVDVSQHKYPKIDTKYGNAMDSMSYDRGMFTHILCMNFTIYHFQDKARFLRNCYNWLMPNGYLIVHLVDRSKYNPIVPIAVPSGLNNPQDYSDKRITDAAVQFPGFSYKVSTDFTPKGSPSTQDDKRVVVTETFKDDTTHNVRQNELTMYMEDINDILFIAGRCGFVVQGSAQFINDRYQYIYVFERQNAGDQGPPARPLLYV